MRGLGSALSALTFTFLWPILTFFLLVEREPLGRVLRYGFSNKEKPRIIWIKIVGATRAYFLGNLVLLVVTYPIFVGLFYLFSVRSPLTLAALASFFNLVPFLGAVLSGLLPLLSLLSPEGHVAAAVGLFGCCVLVHFIVANFVTPKILGARVDLNATTSTLALIVWGELWGGVGLILAIPITATIRILMEQSQSSNLIWLSHLMREKVPETLDLEP
jgi:predicted PurR-regulated permease PerM